MVTFVLSSIVSIYEFVKIKSQILSTLGFVKYKSHENNSGYSIITSYI